MSPTPERTLELAECFEVESVKLKSLGYVNQAKTQDEIAAALRAYTDLSRKWQALLDAEPRVTANSSPCGGCGNKDPDQRCIGCMHQF